MHIYFWKHALLQKQKFQLKINTESIKEHQVVFLKQNPITALCSFSMAMKETVWSEYL